MVLPPLLLPFKTVYAVAVELLSILSIQLVQNRRAEELSRPKDTCSMLPGGEKRETMATNSSCWVTRCLRLMLEMSPTHNKPKKVVPKCYLSSGSLTYRNIGYDAQLELQSYRMPAPCCRLGGATLYGLIGKCPAPPSQGRSNPGGRRSQVRAFEAMHERHSPLCMRCSREHPPYIR